MHLRIICLFSYVHLLKAKKPTGKFDKKKKKDMQRRATPVVMGGDSLDERANEASWDD